MFHIYSSEGRKHGTNIISPVFTLALRSNMAQRGVDSAGSRLQATNRVSAIGIRDLQLITCNRVYP